MRPTAIARAERGERLLAQNLLLSICAPGHNVAARQNSRSAVVICAVHDEEIMLCLPECNQIFQYVLGSQQASA